MTLLVESDHLVEDTDFSLLDRGITKIEYPCWRASHLSSLKVVDDGGRDHISPDRFVWSVLVTQIRLQPLHVQLYVCVFVLHTHSHGFSKTLSAYSGSSRLLGTPQKRTVPHKAATLTVQRQTAACFGSCMSRQRRDSSSGTALWYCRYSHARRVGCCLDRTSPRARSLPRCRACCTRRFCPQASGTSSHSPGSLAYPRVTVVLSWGRHDLCDLQAVGPKRCWVHG
jgi:hypothetical protein